MSNSLQLAMIGLAIGLKNRADHAWEGGEGIINFHAWERGLHEKAIELFGDPAFYIDRPMELEYMDKSYKFLGLYRKGGWPSNNAVMAEFWLVVERLRPQALELQKWWDAKREGQEIAAAIDVGSQAKKTTKGRL